MHAGLHGSTDGVCRIPPEVYDIAFGWDPRPEIERLLLLAREAAVEPRAALELGCGAGRLLAALRARGIDAFGVERSDEMAALARLRSGATVLVGDMTDFALCDPAAADRPMLFDLAYTSANTIRHALTDAAIGGLWRRAAAHLRPGGVFVADLELGAADAREKLGRPARWELVRDGTSVQASWTIVAPPDPASRCCEIEWVFEACGHHAGTWRQRFPLRVYEATEFVQLATAGGGFELCGLHELRDPYLVARPADRCSGRTLVALRRA